MLGKDNFREHLPLPVTALFDLFFSVNDVTVFDEDKFYFTNSMKSRTDPLALFEIVLMLPLGSVGFCDGQSCQTVVHGLVMPNGLTVSQDKK